MPLKKAFKVLQVLNTSANLYSDGNISVYEVAMKLEKQYKIYEKFFENNEDKIAKILSRTIAEYLNGVVSFNFETKFEGRLQSLFRQYMLNEEHGITTYASIKEERKSFLDTGNYITKTRFKLVK